MLPAVATITVSVSNIGSTYVGCIRTEREALLRHVQELHLRNLMLGGKINSSLLDLKHLVYLDLSYNSFEGVEIPRFLGSIRNLSERASVDRRGARSIADMSWRTQEHTMEWLSRCAIGTLKEFSSISSVSYILKSKDFSFSNHYVGEQKILWCFKLEIEKVGFINNRFFWEDCFTSMSSWKDQRIPIDKLVWITICGVSLNCWEEAFFMKVGKQVGEPMWIDQATLSRSRLNKGKMLILTSQVGEASLDIRVSVEGMVVTIKVEFDPIPVSTAWLNSFLRIEEHIHYNRKNCCRSSEAEPIEESDIALGTDRRQLLDTSKSIQKAVRFQNQVVAGNMTEGDKGKKLWARKTKSKAIPFQNRTAKLVIGRKRDQVIRRDLVRDSSTTSSDSKRSWGAFSKISRDQGECSVKTNPYGFGSNGPLRFGPIAKEILGSMKEAILIQTTEMGQVYSKPNEPSDSNPKFRDNTQMELLPKTPKKRKGERRSHAMKTRNLKAIDGRCEEEAVEDGSSGSEWNVEVEIAKVIEKGFVTVKADDKSSFLSVTESWSDLGSPFLHLSLCSPVSSSSGSLSALRSLPTSLTNCTKLVTLDIGENEFSGNIPTWLGERFSELAILNLLSNKFHGLFPTEFFHITSLQILDLAYNNLSGSISSCINNFSATVAFDYSEGNSIQLEVDFGNFIEDALLMMKGITANYNSILNLVRSIDLSKNKFSGEIPMELTSLQALSHCTFRKTRFSGTLPVSLRNCTKLRTLDISNNELAGNIPTWIDRFRSMMILNLHSNKFHHPLPLKLCRLSLQILDISYNNISGTIPRCVDNVSDADKYGSYERSMLDGKINPSLLDLKSLIYMDLSNNDFQGTRIPRFFGFMRNLRYLNLSGARFVGMIPHQLGNLSNLQYLGLGKKYWDIRSVMTSSFSSIVQHQFKVN
ncbi:hypothetical protein Ddye_027414, partial [Dipteronia dyeriana]